MPVLDKAGNIDTQDWQPIGEGQAIPATGRILLPPARFASLPTSGKNARNKADTGLLLESDCNLEEIAGLVARAQLIALHIPAFADGRHFSLARQLRHRLGYNHAILAIGDVQVDQVAYMKRTGIDRYQFSNSRRAEQARERLEPFTATYQ